MTTTEQMPQTCAAYSDPEFTEDEFVAAVGGPRGNNSLVVVIDLYRGRDLPIKTYTQASQPVKDRIRRQAREAITRYRGAYCLVSPAGGVSAKIYHGQAAAEAAVWFSGGSSQAVLLVGCWETFADAAARFLKLFAGNEIVADHLLRRLLRLKRPDLNHSGYRQWALQHGRTLLVEETASA